jgi:hypothetical protein
VPTGVNRHSPQAYIKNLASSIASLQAIQKTHLTVSGLTSMHLCSKAQWVKTPSGQARRE